MQTNQTNQTNSKSSHPQSLKQSMLINKNAWRTQSKSCKDCPYRNQDVDAYPCCQCHTRH
jgi:hypothetical protein